MIIVILVIVIWWVWWWSADIYNNVDDNDQGDYCGDGNDDFGYHSYDAHDYYEDYNHDDDSYDDENFNDNNYDDDNNHDDDDTVDVDDNDDDDDDSLLLVLFPGGGILDIAGKIRDIPSTSTFHILKTSCQPAGCMSLESCNSILQMLRKAVVQFPILIWTTGPMPASEENFWTVEKKTFLSSLLCCLLHKTT